MGIRRAATLPEGPTGDFKGDIKVDDKLPTRKELDRAGDIEVFDKDKKAYKFSDLYSNTDGDKKHTYIIIFIRHFFCGVCHSSRPHFSTLSINLTSSSTSRTVKNISAPSLLSYLPHLCHPQPPSSLSAVAHLSTSLST